MTEREQDLTRYIPPAERKWRFRNYRLDGHHSLASWETHELRKLEAEAYGRFCSIVTYAMRNL